MSPETHRTFPELFHLQCSGGFSLSAVSFQPVNHGGFAPSSLISGGAAGSPRRTLLQICLDFSLLLNSAEGGGGVKAILAAAG